MTALLLLLLKTLLIFAAAGLTLFALRRASAAARHLVCLLTLAALLALPLFSLALPGWQMLPGFVSPVGALLAAPSGSLSPNPTSDFSFPAPSSVSAPKSKPELAATREGASGKEGTPGKEGAASSAPTIILLCVYAVGILIALTRPLLGLWGIRQLSRVSVPLTDAPALSLAADCAAVLHLTRRLDLRQAAVSVPMTWGSRRPVVLLPFGAQNWPEDRLRAVFLHELAHVRRSDWLGHRFADIVGALYWFHPLVWLTARRLRAESEAACDDMVLASGLAAPDYARHLLEIARALPPVSVMPQAVIAMAQTSGVEKRLRMILDETQSRRVLTRRIVLAMFGLSAAGLVPFSMLQTTAKAQTVNALANSQVQETLPMELVGITDATLNTGKWWDADGKNLPSNPMDTYTYPAGAKVIVQNKWPLDSKVTVQSGQVGRVFAFRLPNSLKKTLILFDFPDYTLGGLTYSWAGRKGEMRQGAIRQTVRSAESSLAGFGNGSGHISGAAFPASLSQTRVRVGADIGPWLPIYTVVNPSGQHPNTTSKAASQYLAKDITFSRDKITFTFITPAESHFQATAVYHDGHKVILPMHGSFTEHEAQTSASIPRSSSPIQELRIEVRPLVWKEFKNVALQPDK